MADPEGDQPEPAPAEPAPAAAEPAVAEPEPVAAAAAPVEVTPALYLARCLVADKGYVPGHFAEAAPLVDACDIVLTGGDGVGLAIACIVDRDRDPTRRFTMAPAALDDIAAACRHHAGSVHGVRENVSIEIWEIGAGVPDADDRARLEGYTFRKMMKNGAQVRTYAVNTAPGAVGDLVSTAADGSKREPWIRKVLKEPRRSGEVLAAAARQREKVVARFRTRPVATFALLAAFAAMFVLSLVWTVMPNDDALSPGLGTLISLGALDHGRVEDGEYWRMLTCAFLHGGFMHILFNSVAMYMAGGVLENLVGRAWMLALFVIGAIGGSAASMAINPAHIASVGASGAIMGLLAAAMVVCLRLPKGPARSQILVSLGYILLPSLLPLFAKGENVDYAAHIGGAIVGAVAGGLLLLTWPRDAEAPRAGKLAAAVAAAGLLFTGYGLVQAASDHGMYRQAFAGRARHNPELVKLMVPDDQLPHTAEDALARVPALLESHPHDPRVQYWAGLLAYDRQEFAVAITHFEKALAERGILSQLAAPADFEAIVRYFLSRTYEATADADGAKNALQPSCSFGKSSDEAEIRTYYERMCATP